MRILGDMPLFCHAIEHAKKAHLVDVVVIDSENNEILRIGAEHGAIPLKRPENLANNIATGDDLAYWQATNYPFSDIVLQVVPTAPFLSSESIDNAIKILQENPNVDSVAGVYIDTLYTWTNGRPDYYNTDGSIPNSTDLREIVYETTGLYANHTKACLKTRRRLNPRNCVPCVLSRIEATDINTMQDFEFAEIIWKGIHH